MHPALWRSYSPGGSRPASQASLPAVPAAIPTSSRGVPDISMDSSCRTRSPAYHTDMLDETVGNNVQAGTGISGYGAGPGWDAVTGLGTPDAAKLFHALAAG